MILLTFFLAKMIRRQRERLSNKDTRERITPLRRRIGVEETRTSSFPWQSPRTTDFEVGASEFEYLGSGELEF